MKILRHVWPNYLHTYTPPVHFTRAQSQYDTTECGVYVMQFITLRVLGNETEIHYKILVEKILFCAISSRKPCFRQ
jgi:hypothetical protein